MQSIKTILLFEAKYRHDILGLSLDEIENQLKNYPTQDAEELLKRLRGDLSVDSLNRGEETEEDISVTEDVELQEFFSKGKGNYSVPRFTGKPSPAQKKMVMSKFQDWTKVAEKKSGTGVEPLSIHFAPSAIHLYYAVTGLSSKNAIEVVIRNGKVSKSNMIPRTSIKEADAKEAYRDKFNKMLKDAGASNISELTPEKRKAFFLKLDKSWKAKNEKKVNEDVEFEWTDDVVAEYAAEFAEFADVLKMIKKEIDTQVLEEASKTKRTTMTRVTRQTKIDRAIGSLSVQYAKAVNDPMYKKFKKYKDKWMKFKERIQAKYKARVRTAARQGGGIGHLLKDKQKSGATTGKSTPAKKKK